jgi:hypothetical protein
MNTRGSLHVPENRDVVGLHFTQHCRIKPPAGRSNAFFSFCSIATERQRARSFVRPVANDYERHLRTIQVSLRRPAMNAVTSRRFIHELLDSFVHPKNRPTMHRCNAGRNCRCKTDLLTPTATAQDCIRHHLWTQLFASTGASEKTTTRFRRRCLPRGDFER